MKSQPLKIDSCRQCHDRGYQVVGIGWRYCNCAKGRDMRKDGQRRGIYGK